MATNLYFIVTQSLHWSKSVSQAGQDQFPHFTHAKPMAACKRQYRRLQHGQIFRYWSAVQCCSVQYRLIFFVKQNPLFGVFYYYYFGGATYALLDAVGRRSTVSCSSPELLSLSITRILLGARFATWGRTNVSWGTEAALRLPM